MRNFIWVMGDYLRSKGMLIRSIETWPRHIDHVERQYNKEFFKNCLFGNNLVDRIYKQVQVLIQSCDTTSLDDIKMSMLPEFGEIQRWVE